MIFIRLSAEIRPSGRVIPAFSMSIEMREVNFLFVQSTLLVEDKVELSNCANAELITAENATNAKIFFILYTYYTPFRFSVFLI